jgi:hypothetical protein
MQMEFSGAAPGAVKRQGMNWARMNIVATSKFPLVQTIYVYLFLLDAW